MNTRKHGLLLLMVFIFLFLFAFPTRVRAVVPSYDMTIEPAFSDITIGEHDASASAKIKIFNNTDREQKYDVFAIDFQQVDDQGNVALVDRISKDYTYHLSSYMTVASTLTISSHGTKDIDVIIRNTQDFSPGGHYGAVVARFAKEAANGQAQQILPAVSSLLFVRKLGGERFALTIKETNWHDQLLQFSLPHQISFLFLNEGNVHVVPHGQVLLTDLFGRSVAKGIIMNRRIKF